MPIVVAALVVAGATYAASKSQKAPKQAAGVNIGDVVGENLQSNIANAPEAEMLSRRTNQFNQQQKLSLLEQAIPGYSKWASSMSQNAQDQAAGKISKESATNLTRLAAERGINTGARGQANDYSLLRDFGVSQMQGQGQSMNIMQTLAGLSQINPMSPLSMYSTPGQALGVAQQNQSNNQAYMNSMNAYENQQRAAPWQAISAGAGAYMGMSGGAAGAAKGATNTYSGPMASTGQQSYAQSTPFLQQQNYSQAPSYFNQTSSAKAATGW